MSKQDEVNAAWDQVDVATNSLATRVQALIDEINHTADVGLNGPQTEAVLARLAALKGVLDGMGSNPNTPIPPIPPETPIPGPFVS